MEKNIRGLLSSKTSTFYDVDYLCLVRGSRQQLDISLTDYFCLKDETVEKPVKSSKLRYCVPRLLQYWFRYYFGATSSGADATHRLGSGCPWPGRVAQSVGHLTGFDTRSGNILSFLLPLFLRRAVVSYWRKYVHEVLVNRLGGLSLPRKSVVRLTDRPDMTLDVYRGRKTTMQQQQQWMPLVQIGMSFDMYEFQELNI